MIKYILIGVLIINSGICAAKERCYSNLSEVMKCFMQHKDDAYQYQPLPQEWQEKDGVAIKSYILDSQKWPIEPNEHIPTTTWQHKLYVYIPREVAHHKALIYVAGGYNHQADGSNAFSQPKEGLNYVQLAINNKAPIFVLEDVPNQHLYIDNVAKKEDQIIAFTYKQIMNDPMENAYLSAHLPMSKAIIKAMDAAQDILAHHNIEVTDFMLVGASKRGWAVWLASLEDERVLSIVPIVIDILNVQKNIQHICNSYKGYCPPALRDYEAEGMIEGIGSKEFTNLMKIDDPLSYLYSPNAAQYESRFSIPKYIVNAAGDDFYAPDSSKFYFNQLPGNNYIRYLPEAMHYFAGNPVSDALNNVKRINDAIDSYFYFELNKTMLPKLSWHYSATTVHVSSSIKPDSVILWSAHNDEERDFRFLNSYSKIHLGIKYIKSLLFKYIPISLCDNCYIKQEIAFNCDENNTCHINVNLPTPQEGWQASFLELHYTIAGKEFITTTEVNITPDTYPDHIFE